MIVVIILTIVALAAGIVMWLAHRQPVSELDEHLAAVDSDVDNPVAPDRRLRGVA